MPEHTLPFGEYIRKLRDDKEITLRKFAQMVGISATYLSKVERGEFPAPAEDKVKAMAKILGINADELLGLAGKVASDLPDIIRENPEEMATFLRTMSGMSAAEITRMRESLEANKGDRDK